MTERKARDFENLSPEQRAAYEDGDLENQVGTSGLNNAGFVEPVPILDVTTAEKVIKNDHNAWIILGRDRPADISIDKNFALVGNKRSLERSGIGIKADAVRVIGREGVKIVTGKAKNVEGAGRGGEKNSAGGKIETVAGIELIAGNDVNAQPLESLAKSESLSETLKEIVDSIRDLNNIVNDLFKAQTQMNKEFFSILGTLVAALPPQVSSQFYAKVTRIEASRMSGFENLKKHKVNLKVGLETDHLSPIGKKWYGSRFNKTN